MVEIKLKDLRGLLKLKLDEDECLTYETKALLGTGENYGSTMLAVDVKIFRKGKEFDATERHYVAKMCPPSLLIQDLFNTPVTYKKELGLYTDIVPLLQQFQREHGVDNVIDFIPKLEGFRLSLNPDSKQVDNDAVMLFRNLKHDGYELCNRFEGFDLTCAEFLIKDLAVFHAVPLAFKMERPEEFKEKIRPFLDWCYGFELDEVFQTHLIDVFVKTAALDEECKPHLDSLRKAFAFGKICYQNRPPVRELFATITHNDYWVNNTLIKFGVGKPVKNAMVDFQVIEYGSPAEDVIFFLYSSVTPKVLAENYDHLVTLYYETFIATLKQLNCDPNPFTFELLQEELALSARTLQFYHTVVMLPAIFTKKGAVKELSELSNDDLMKNTEQTTEEFPEKVWILVKDFVKRGWI